MNSLVSQEYLSPKDAAVVLGVHRSTIMRLIHSKKIPFIKLGKRTYRIPMDTINQIMKERRIY